MRPDGFAIPDAATAVHGVTTEQALTEGVALAAALARLGAAAVEATEVVAHNARFDRGVFADEARRLGVRDPLDGLPWVNTMRLGTDACALPSAYEGRYKPPTLDELHRHLLGGSVENAHTALADARAAARCLVALRGQAEPYRAG